ncbi:Uncharacterised protein [Klebsiella pneumoniae]|nr:Uncharacterised protein [Klebsiella pneumoniae]
MPMAVSPRAALRAGAIPDFVYWETLALSCLR